MHIKTLVKFGLSVLILLFGSSSFALDLSLPDRLNLPSRHFNHIEQTAFLDLAKIDSRILAVGERGVIGFSDDGGDTWHQADVPISVLMTSLQVINSDEVWAVGHSGAVLYSSDKAESWDVKLDGNQVNKLLVEHAQTTLKNLKEAYQQAEGYEKEDLEYAVEDAEFALSNAEYDLDLGPSNPFLDLVFMDKQKGLAVGAYGLIVSTQDGGESWQTIADRMDNLDRYHLNAIAQLKGGAIIIAGEAGTLFVSYDEGEMWETVYGPYQGSFFGVQPTSNVDEALIYGLKGHIFKTTDAGQSWERVAVDVETSLTSSAISNQGTIAIAGLSGVVLISRDSGESFERLPTAGFEGFNAVEFVDENSLLLVSDEGIRKLSIQ